MTEKQTLKATRLAGNALIRNLSPVRYKWDSDELDNIFEPLRDDFRSEGYDTDLRKEDSCPLYVLEVDGEEIEGTVTHHLVPEGNIGNSAIEARFEGPEEAINCAENILKDYDINRSILDFAKNY